MKYLIVVDMQNDFITGTLGSKMAEVKITVDGKCCAGVSVESHNIALNAMKAVQIEVK